MRAHGASRSVHKNWIVHFMRYGIPHCSKHCASGAVGMYGDAADFHFKVFDSTSQGANLGVE